MEWSSECKTIYNNIIQQGNLNQECLLMNKENSEIKDLLAYLKNGKKGELPKVQSEIIERLLDESQKLLCFKEKVEGRGIYTFSVMGHQLLEYDRMYFEDKFRNNEGVITLNDTKFERVIDVLYKPYYCEAIINVGYDRGKQSIIEAKIEETYKSGKNWIPVKECEGNEEERFCLEIYFSASPFQTFK